MQLARFQSLRSAAKSCLHGRSSACAALKFVHSSDTVESALYLVATPLGNLEDITLRALRVLHNSDVIFCEDCRHTQKLTSHFGITTPRVSYHQHNEAKRNDELLYRLQQGQAVALVSDAGCPGISDPGTSAVNAALHAGHKVVPIPGPSAVLAGLIGSGMSTEHFLFAGFLPPKASARRQQLEDYRRTVTVCFML
jgi:16S rRNA (cytidine1402-2'-O)-methyltransferase